MKQHPPKKEPKLKTKITELTQEEINEIFKRWDRANENERIRREQEIRNVRH